MKRILFSCLVLSGLLASPAVAQLTPYDGLRYRKDLVEVRHKGTWYQLEAIGDVQANELVTFCKGAYGEIWRKRFAEDLVDALLRKGETIGGTTDLTLIDLKTRETLVARDVPMTAANRLQVWSNWKEASGMKGDRAQFKPKPQPKDKIDVGQWTEDLAKLRTIMGERFAYRDLRGIELNDAFQATADSLDTKDLTVGNFARAVHRLIQRFGDGHAGVQGRMLRPASGYVPCLFGEADGGIVAFQSNRSDFLDADHPFVVAIDGQPIKAWIEAAKRDVTAAAEPTMRWRAVHSLREFARVRSALNDSTASSLELTLATRKGKQTKVKLDIVERRPTYGAWPSKTPNLPENIAYLRIDSMEREPEFLARIDATMAGAKNARALIVDVRGNGGGSRDALRHLFPYFMGPKDAPHIANVAAYRIPPPERDAKPRDGFLSNRFLYLAEAECWSDAAREAIAKASEKFKPQWAPPAADFSDWHWMVLEREANPKAYHFDKPVVVLLDTGCFSATDIFLGALKGWNNVTLLGTPSGGGSARSRRYRLPQSGIEIRLASMASFQPNGQLYDGVGVAPDALVLPNPEDLIGRGDAQLAAALKSLK